MKASLSCLLGIALSSWICFKLFQESKPKNPVRARVRDGFSADDDGELIVEETRDESPTQFLTKIESFSLFPTHSIEKYETREFEAGDYKWKLVIYPNGRTSSLSDGYVSVYLALAETNSLPIDWEFNAIFTIFLYNHILDKYLCVRGNTKRFSETKFEWGFPKFISKTTLEDESSGYLVDDNLILGAEVFVHKRKRVVERVTLLRYQQTRDWTIPEFSKLEEVWISEEFAMRGFNWKMKLYPKGDSTSKDFEVTIYLVCVSAGTFDAHQKVKTKLYVRLKGKSKSKSTMHQLGKLSHWFTSSDASCGTSLISLANLHNPKNGFLVDDSLTLQVEISIQVVV